jgi:hypothetical protein
LHFERKLPISETKDLRTKQLLQRDREKRDGNLSQVSHNGNLFSVCLEYLDALSPEGRMARRKIRQTNVFTRGMMSFAPLDLFQDGLLMDRAS